MHLPLHFPPCLRTGKPDCRMVPRRLLEKGRVKKEGSESGLEGSEDLGFRGTLRSG